MERFPRLLVHTAVSTPNLFDDIFGSGTSEKLFNGRVNSELCESCYDSFISFCNSEVAKINKKRDTDVIQVQCKEEVIVVNFFFEDYPKTVNVCGVEVPVVTDFREYIKLFAMLKDESLNEYEKICYISQYFFGILNGR